MPTAAILNSHSVSVLRKEISKTNIKGYSKMKKAEVIALMMRTENRPKFHHIKMKEGKAKEITIIPVRRKKQPKPEAKKSTLTYEEARKVIKYGETRSPYFSVADAIYLQIYENENGKGSLMGVLENDPKGLKRTAKRTQAKYRKEFKDEYSDENFTEDEWKNLWRDFEDEIRKSLKLHVWKRKKLK